MAPMTHSSMTHSTTRRGHFYQARRPLALAATALVAGAALTACSSSDKSSDKSGTVKIVASTELWASVVKKVAGNSDKLEITSLISGNSVDPHDYTPSAKDMAAVKDATIVVGNGGGYDNWLTSQAASSATVITAMPISEHDHTHDHGHDHSADGTEAESSASTDAHDHSEEAHADHTDETTADHSEDAHADHSGEASADHSDEATTHDHDDEVVNPHIWYDTATVKKFADTIATTLNAKVDGLNASPDAFKADVDKVQTQLSALPAKRVASTESIAGYLIAESSLTDVTPSGYMEASLKESEPSAADVAAFTDLINQHGLDLLVVNPQTEDSVSTTLADAAKAAGIPTVNVYETPASGTDYLTFLQNTVSDLAKATA